LIRARIRALDLDGSVALSPPIHPARKAFALARCVVIPSLAESLPYIVLEVLASRVPLLTTRVGGIPEIFGPHSDRLLPPGSASALALAMKASLADPVRARTGAEALHTHVKRRFRVPRMVDAVVDFYGDVVGSGSGGS
jgi:glycosyltransferase involved in cell wall biosynthesis